MTRPMPHRALERATDNYDSNTQDSNTGNSDVGDSNMQDHNTGDYNIAIPSGSSDQPAPVSTNSKPDGDLEIPHIKQLLTAIASTLQNHEDHTFSTDELWTAVLSSLDPKHEIFQSLNPLREIPKFYNKFRKQAIGEYGAVADLKGKFGTSGKTKAKGKAKAKASQSKSEPAGVGDKKAGSRKQKWAGRLTTEETVGRKEKRKEKRAAQKQRRRMFNLQGLGRALPEIEA
ncbi:hypothetical protein BST61_g2680 [Cercospora zeina]